MLNRGNAAKTYLDATHKQCSKCKAIKLHSEFSYCKSNVQSLHLSSWCNDCTKEYNRKKSAAYKKANREKLRDAKYKRDFGISLDVYNQMLEEQHYSCKICGTQECSTGKNFAVDHCHTTGRVRGLLCQACNAALGLFKDNVETMKNAIVYLNHE